MINFLLQLLYNFLSFLINLLPTGTVFPSSVHTAFSTLGGYFGIMDSFISLSVLYWCLITIFGVEVAIFGFKTIKWVISHLPWIGGKGNQ
jgi:hypothetical protein